MLINKPTECTYDLFISYTDANCAWVQGYLMPAIGLPPENIITPQNFRLGEPVLTEFERAITNSRYTVLVLSPDYLADRWSSFSESLASYVSVEEQRGRLIPLFLQFCEVPMRVKLRMYLDCTDEANWEKEVTRLRSLLNQPEPKQQRIACPYPGMVPFNTKDARFFYGRNAEIQQMLQHLRHQRCLFVIGPSGSGKSSLVFAGFLPRLSQSADFPQDFWLVRNMRPGSQPVRILSQILPARLPSGRLLLVIDQFEELFTQTEEPERTRFIAILKALHNEPRCALLIVMRADFFPDLMLSELWPLAPYQRLEIAPLRGEALRQAIQQPAANVGVYLEASLLEHLMKDALDEPGVLPLVQETMVLLWKKLRHRLLTLSAYERIGGAGRNGLMVAITTKANAALVELSPAQQAIARRIFLRLVQFGEGRADTRRQQPIVSLRAVGDEPHLFDSTLRHLVENRLLTLSGREGDPDSKVDIAHEILISGWPTLQGWVIERREAELTRRQLNTKAAEWVRLGQGSGGLLDEVELLEAERWLNSSDANELGHDENLSKLVKISQAAIKQRKNQLRRIARFRFTALFMIVILIIAVLVAIAIGQGQLVDQERKAVGTATVLLAKAQNEANARATEVVARRTAEAGVQENAFLAATRAAEAVAAKETAESLAQIALSRQLAAQAINHLDDQPDLALLLGLEAYRGANTLQARSCLLTGLEHDPRLIAFMRGYEDSVKGLAFSPDGRTMALGIGDSTIVLWDVITHQQIGQPFTGHDDSVLSVAFSPDGTKLASGSGDFSIILWDVETGKPIGNPLTGHFGMVLDVAFSPDGTKLASGGEDNNIILWNIESGQPIGEPLIGHAGWVHSVSFSPDGKTLSSGSSDKTVILWDVETAQPLGQPLAEHVDTVYDVAFSPDGQVLASGGGGNPNIILWDVGTRTSYYQDFLESQDSHVGVVVSMAFSPDGQILISAGIDGKIILRDVKTGRIVDRLVGHLDFILSMALGPDGKMLASGSEDRVVILWDIAARQRLGRSLGGHVGRVLSVAFSPDGKILASGSCGKPDADAESCNQGEIRLWEAVTGQPVGRPLAGHDDLVLSVAFSPDGKTLASGSLDNSIILWDVETGQPIGRPLAGHTDWIWSVAFSPDGETLASGSFDRSIILWDVETGQPIDKLLGQDARITDVAFSPDGKTLASSSGFAPAQTLILWDISTGQSMGEFTHFAEQRNAAWSIAFSPDGQVLASGNLDNSIILWDVETRQPLIPPLIGHKSPPGSLAFNPDGKMLASGGFDNSIILWDVRTGQPIGQPLNAHTSSVNSVAFSSDGKMLASGSGDRTVILWDVSVESWQAHACDMVNRNLTQAEWNQYIDPDIPYECTCPDLPPGEGVALDTSSIAAITSTVEPTPTSDATHQALVTQESVAITPTATPIPTFGPTPTPHIVVHRETWRTEIYDMPDGLSLEFPAILQCRESADSTQLVQHYVGVWVVRVEKEEEWVSRGEAQVVLETDAGIELGRYDISFQTAANTVDFLVPSENLRGKVMLSSGPKVSIFKLSFHDVEWKPTSETVSRYSYEIEFLEHGISRSLAYPKHHVAFQVHNVGSLTMHGVDFFGILQDKQGDTVDILRGVQAINLDSGESRMFAIESFSQSGRCVGPANSGGYTLHYWLIFATEDGQPITRYYETAID